MCWGSGGMGMSGCCVGNFGSILPSLFYFFLFSDFLSRASPSFLFSSHSKFGQPQQPKKAATHRHRHHIQPRPSQLRLQFSFLFFRRNCKSSLPFLVVSRGGEGESKFLMKSPSYGTQTKPQSICGRKKTEEKLIIMGKKRAQTQLALFFFRLLFFFLRLN